MLNLGGDFEDPTDVKLALFVVSSLLAIPIVMYAFGFRLLRITGTVSKRKTMTYTVLLFFGWMFVMATGPFAPNFGLLLMHWFYLPLVIQYNISLVLAWPLPPLMIISALVIPYWYCKRLSRLLLQYRITRK